MAKSRCDRQRLAAAARADKPETRYDLELEDRMVTLRPHQGFTVPKGVMHPRGRAVVL